jgi:hypothetical protein
MSKKVGEKWFVRGDFEKVDEKRLMKGEKIVGQNGKYGWSTKILFPKSASTKTKSWHKIENGCRNFQRGNFFTFRI